jgi:hypothetical protein
MNYYGTVALADEFFEDRLLTQWWFGSTVRDRERSLIMATRAIDRLNYAGEKTSDDQELQFPRGNDSTVPDDILNAAYECALKYICGVDIDDEIRNIGMGGVQIAGGRGSVKPSFVPEHLRAGIPSAEAWIYLRPYLRDPYCFVLSRA